MIFTLRPLSGDDMVWATAQDAAINDVGRNMCVAAASVAAINGTPLYEAMSVEGTEGFRIADPLYPPKGVRFAASGRFLQMCIQEPGMQSILFGVNQLYSMHFELANRHSIPSLDGEVVVWQCPNDNFNSELAPRIDPHTKEVLPYHCMLCGAEMQPTREFEVGENPFEQPRTTSTSPNEDISSPKPE